MTRKTVLSVVFLSITCVAVSWELTAVVDPHDDLVPWTDLIADYVPPAVAWAAVVLLVSWLPGHLVEAFTKRGKIMGPTVVPATPEPGAPKEPLWSVSTVTGIVVAALGIATAFGLHLTEKQTYSVIVFVGAVAPFVVAYIARKKVFSPNTVRAMVVTAAATGEVATEPTPATRDIA
jgi:hypothetical protein